MRRLRLNHRLAITAVLAASTITGSAHADLRGTVIGGNCGATTPVFQAWGDQADYYAPANGGFESASAGWTLTGGAAVVPGNEPFLLAGSGSHSLRIPSGGRASISVCYGLTYPAIRFLVSGTATPTVVHVRVISHGLLGIVSALDGGTFTASSGWAPSPRLSTLLTALAAPLGTKSMELELSVESGTATIDDVYVDPFLTKS